MLDWLKPRKNRAASVPERTTPPARVSEISAAELETLMESSGPLLVLDVREPYEQTAGTIPGAISMPMSTLTSRLAELPRDLPIVAYCEAGVRSWSVAEFLLRQGYPDVKSLRGGFGAWARQSS